MTFILWVWAFLALCLQSPAVFAAAPAASGEAPVIDTLAPDQIEVGGPYAGIEFHHGSVEPSRISFFYPVANSIDLSGDYWTRGDNPVLTVRLKRPAIDLAGETPYRCKLTPYSVTFMRDSKLIRISVSYRFCMDKPALVMMITLTNDSSAVEEFSLDTSLETSVKTSSTFALKDQVRQEYDADRNAIYATHREPETQNAVIFAVNAGEHSTSHSFTDTTTGRAVAAFRYGHTLAPGQTLSIVQIIGTCRSGEEREMADYLRGNYQKEIEEYERSIVKKVHDQGMIATGIDSLDRTALWAKATIAANAHYLEGRLVPMPCPAEYNLFFTHDTLQTDFEAINLDPARVKRDLLFIAGLADKNGVIPHARYWKDDHFHTEYAGADNWNHFWFLTVSAKYLRHTGDTETLKILYPLLLKSVKLIRSNCKENIIYANRPDWWDIGDSFGARSYMTIHAIRSFREFAYICTVLDRDHGEARKCEDTAEAMQKQLIERLWDGERGYLFNNYGDGKLDSHYYMGSLLAAHYGLLDSDRLNAMIETAKKKLLQENTGIFNVYPMDFLELGDLFHFRGDEAGRPFYYLNGGIWYHGNAWYALALMAAERNDEALAFIEKIMTLDGIACGPGGQPALYECRNGDSSDSRDFGRVDKPQFLWAAAWYLYAVQNLFGYRENESTIAFEPWLPAGRKTVEYGISLRGKPIRIITRGSGKYLQRISYDGASLPSAVIPEDMRLQERIELTLGRPGSPYISSANAMLRLTSSSPAQGTLSFTLRALPGHANRIKIISPRKLMKIALNRDTFKGGCRSEQKDEVYISVLEYMQATPLDRLELGFDGHHTGSSCVKELY